MSLINNLPRIAGYKSIKQEVEPGIYNICACGLSSSQPFCDGSHKGTDFAPIKFRVMEAQRFSFCTCKRSLKMPICDGEHKKLVQTPSP